MIYSYKRAPRRGRGIVKALMFLLTLGIVFALVRTMMFRPLPPVAFTGESNFLVFAHRGASGIAPENTMVAFSKALEAGADVLELDVRATRDGHVVVFHDDTVDRTTNGTGRVDQMDLGELRRLDAGYDFSPDNGNSFPYLGQGITVPLLSEVLQAFPRTRMSIEIKDYRPGVERLVLDVLESAGARDRVLVASFDGPTLRRFRRLAPGYASSTASDETRNFVLLSKVALGKVLPAVANALSVPERDSGITVVTPSFVRAANAAGMQVYVWTINDPAGIRRMIGMGVNGIISDHPDRVVAALKELGLR